MSSNGGNHHIYHRLRARDEIFARDNTVRGGRANTRGMWWCTGASEAGRECESARWDTIAVRRRLQQFYRRKRALTLARAKWNGEEFVSVVIRFFQTEKGSQNR